MKKYTLINNESGKKSYYSSFAWNLAWTLVFLSGIVFGACLFGIITF